MLAQLHVVDEWAAPVHREPETEVRVVVQVRAGRDHPVHEPRLHERDERGHAEPGGRHRAGEAHAHRHLGFEHPLGEQAARLSQAPGVVGEERIVDQLGKRLPTRDGSRIDARAAQEVFPGRHPSQPSSLAA